MSETPVYHPLQTREPRSLDRLVPSRPMPVRRPVAAAAEEDGLELSFFWNTFARWWRVIVPSVLLIAGVGTLLSFRLFTPKYRAAAYLQIDDIPKTVVAAKAEDNSRRFAMTQVELLRSPVVLIAALKDPELASMPELARRKSPWEWLAKKKLEVAPVNDSELLVVAYEGPDPVKSAKLVDGIVNTYLMHLDNEQERQDNLLIQALEAQEREQRKRLENMEEEVRQLKKRLPGDATVLPNRRQGIVFTENPVKDLQKQLSEGQLELIQLEAEIRATEELIAKPAVNLGAGMIDMQIDQDPAVAATKQEIDQLRSQLDEIERVARGGKSNPRYAQTQAALVQAEQQLQQQRQEARPRVEQLIASAGKQQFELELIDLRRARDVQQARVDQLAKRIADEAKRIDESGNATLELEFALERLVPAQEVLTQITHRLTNMRTERSRPARVRVSQSARASEEPVKWLPLTGLLATAATALALPFGLALLWEFNVRRITSVDQLEKGSTHSVIGEIAQLPIRHGSRLDVQAQAKVADIGLFEESIDSLRTGLILADENQDVQVIAVTSAVSGEGKTSVSSQLAVSLARATGKPVLLIDGDMRSPDIHAIFQISRTPGLAEVLAGKCRLDDAVNRTWSDSVHLLPAGELTCNPHKLLGTPAFHELLEEARLWYRYVVIDTPPLLAASEALVMAREADGALLCAMRDFSREGHVKLAYRRLQQIGARPLGKVLSGVPVRQYAYRYGTYGYVGPDA